MWTGQLVSTAGSALTSLAAGIFVYRLTGSALSVGLMMMATALPTLFVGVIAGVFVDRYDRRRIMIAADLIRAALVLLIPFLIPIHIAWLYILVVGSLALILPGLGQPAAEWKRAIRLLRGAQVAPGLGAGRAATLADLDLLAARLPALSGLSAKLRQNLAAQSLVADAPGGAVVVRRGEASDAAYFILSGRAVAGLAEDGEYRLLEVLNPGDFFGEIAALTGAPRTANVITEEPTTLLHVPAPALREMMSDPNLHRLFVSKMTERMVRVKMLDMPRVGGLDQQALQELRAPGAEAAA
jgi:CRP-like cAMP-binding protein